MLRMAKSNKVKELFTVKKLAIPLVIGLGVTLYMLWVNTDWEQFNKVHWGIRTLVWMFVGLMMMAIRDLAYMYRIWVLTNKQTYRLKKTQNSTTSKTGSNTRMISMPQADIFCQMAFSLHFPTLRAGPESLN